MHSIHLAIPADLPRLVEIYNQAIHAGRATADTIPFSIESRHKWFNLHSPDSHPIYCLAEEGELLGYLSVSPYRDRSALQRTAELSYYVDYRVHGQGIGSALMQHAIEDASRIGKKIYLAIVLEINTASHRLLEKYNFERWGYLPEVAEIDGQTCGHIYFGRKV